MDPVVLSLWYWGQFCFPPPLSTKSPAPRSSSLLLPPEVWAGPWDSEALVGVGVDAGHCFLRTQMQFCYLQLQGECSLALLSGLPSPAGHSQENEGRDVPSGKSTNLGVP